MIYRRGCEWWWLKRRQLSGNWPNFRCHLHIILRDNREFNERRTKRKGTGYNAAITRNHDPRRWQSQPIRWLVMGKIEAWSAILNTFASWSCCLPPHLCVHCLLHTTFVTRTLEIHKVEKVLRLLCPVVGAGRMSIKTSSTSAAPQAGQERNCWYVSGSDC